MSFLKHFVVSKGVPWVRRYSGTYKDLNINIVSPGKDATLGSGDGNIHAWDIRNEPPNKVASMDSHIDVPSCLKWAPQRVAFVAAAASVLTLQIPNDEANNPDAKPKPATDFIHGCFILSPYVS